MLGGMLPKKTKRRRMKVSQARRVVQAEEAEKLIDMEEVTRIALEKAQQEGIVFLDEIDKVVARGSAGGPDVSREGVQRDLLPVVEGCPVQTKYGTVHTDHILFISAGAFQKVKPSDLVAELQGRFPIRVELNALSKDDLSRILMEPENSLIKQYQALLHTEDVELVFTDDGIKAISEFAEKMNHEMENIGARRLHTMIEQLLEELSFDAPEYAGKTVSVDEGFVNEKLGSLVKDADMRRYLL
jgi:ATP-dependent HslUV protease ATP-binding subunit HslU